MHLPLSIASEEKFIKDPKFFSFKINEIQYILHREFPPFLAEIRTDFFQVIDNYANLHPEELLSHESVTAAKSFIIENEI